MTHPSVIDNKCVKYYPDPTWQWVMARTRISGICALWPLPSRYDLRSQSWHTLGSWTTIVWNIIQIQLGSEELWPGHRFPVCVHCDLDLGDMILSQGHDTPLGHGNNCVKLYPDWTREYKVMARTRCEQTDGRTDRQTEGQTDRAIPIYPQKLCLRGV